MLPGNLPANSFELPSKTDPCRSSSGFAMPKIFWVFEPKPRLVPWRALAYP